MIEIANKVYYVGVNDRNKALFEGLWPLPYGVSYNSYLIDDEKVCLIDTVEVDFFVQFIENLREVLGDRQIDYLVINHMEPDHSGSLALLRKYYPDIQVIGNKKTFDMMAGFYGIKDNTIEMKNGEELSLGSHTLQFFMTPMIHWPETMMTLCKGDVSHLFTGDAFGCFGALNGGFIDQEIDTEWAWLEMVRYYSNIVGKYGIPVQNALKKLAGIHIDYICSTHGPVWHKYVDKVISLYDRMSKYETDPGLVICYGTMYGNTERMAEQIARSASLAGVKDIRLYNVSKTHHSYILQDIFRFRGLIVGAPTYNAGLYHEMDVLLQEVANRDIKHHLIGWFGSYSWASKAVAAIGEWNENRLHFEKVGEPVEMKQALTPEIKAECTRLGREMAARLLEEPA
ncbi:FprA family A-type flavoprotein [Prevotella denticola]|uniref:Metallo-beta-lactamase domain protein n=1 Tax=Prevotella denticola CRIS 18C-A TaxID=944557 RepID=F0H983_9BACT|nr:FprA family A-type flavoprotein [Prevotella denticola]AXV49261.1 FprA family A-type flavoprotein [Prevotella denticola]EGC85727.1 metallo-beta-lactamase domain protein [Prevotella denticola CRIS 18C-A]MBW4715151.1 FprA family A-type flavoprotein [Prevotella denticola]MBW4752929.1 FprA family A-type flavoprotein [Prevotella denticola]QUB90806.1 FprA family A-type flavoprotein [Prevotella denticola]